MLILTIRSDKPEAEIGLFDSEEKLAYSTWQAHRELAETIHLKTREVLSKNQKSLTDIEGIAVFKGPGSFTGLRIGISVANALADGLNVPVVGARGDDWTIQAVRRLINHENDRIVLPEYGASPHVTAPKR